MLGTELHWVSGPWTGGLAVASRPRGGEWLEDEMASWRASGVDTVVSLLEREEEASVGLGREASEARAHGMRFRSLPIADRDVPEGVREFVKALDDLDEELAGGRKVVVHCRQGWVERVWLP